MSSSMGALIAIKFFFGEFKEYDYRVSYLAVSFSIFVISIFLLFGVQDILKVNSFERTLIDQAMDIRNPIRNNLNFIDNVKNSR